MKNIQYLKSLLYVALAATSYGMLATFVRLAYRAGYSTMEVTWSQALLGLLGLLIIHLIIKRKNNSKKNYTRKEVALLILFGTSFGLTSVFYYLAVHYNIPISICIVLLMQSVWMGAMVDFIINKKKPTLIQILAIIVILIGTVLGTNVLNESHLKLNLYGVLFGLLAAMSYTFSMVTTNKIAPQMAASLRSVYLLLGATLIITLIWIPSFISQPFHFSIFYKWGVILAIFGTILPPFLFAKGMPRVGIGVGSIIASLELPISILMAKIILEENVSLVQWIGVSCILLSIILLNYSVAFGKEKPFNRRKSI